jgi:hypothetical protein
MTAMYMSVFINNKVDRTVIIRVLSYGFETWSLKLYLIVFENLVLRKVFGPKSESAIQNYKD